MKHRRLRRAVCRESLTSSYWLVCMSTPRRLCTSLFSCCACTHGHAACSAAPSRPHKRALDVLRSTIKTVNCRVRSCTRFFWSFSGSSADTSHFMSQALAPRLMPMKSSCSATHIVLNMWMPQISQSRLDGKGSSAEHCQHTVTTHACVPYIIPLSCHASGPLARQNCPLRTVLEIMLLL